MQTIRKNKLILMFLINCNNFFTETYLKPSRHLRFKLFVALGFGLQLSTNVTKNSILGVLESLNPPVEL